MSSAKMGKEHVLNQDRILIRSKKLFGLKTNLFRKIQMIFYAKTVIIILLSLSIS